MRRLSLFIGCCLSLLSTTIVQAELGASPMVLSLEARPGTTVKAVVQAYVTSPSDSEIDVRLADLQDQWGKFGYIPSPALAEEGHVSPNSCLRWITVDSSKPLKPDQAGRIAIPVSIDVPADANGLTYAALVIRETSLEGEALSLEGELVVPIFVRTRGAFYPLDIDIKGISSTKDLSKTAATLSFPPRVILYQQDNTNNYAGHMSGVELATNFPAQILTSINPTRTGLAEMSADTPPSHDGGRSQFDLKVIANHVRIEELTAEPGNVAVGDFTLQVMPDFTMLYTAKCIPSFDATGDAKEWIAAIMACVEHESKALERLDGTLQRVQTDIQRQRQWLSQMNKTQDLSLSMLEENEQRIEQALYRVRLIHGNLANAELWLELARAHDCQPIFQGEIENWLLHEALPWIQTFLTQWQRWQKQPEVLHWQCQMETAVYLPTENGPLTEDVLDSIPAMGSLGVMPILPQRKVNDNIDQISLSNEYHWSDRPLRNILQELTLDSHQMFIVDPAVDGRIWLRVRKNSLEPVLDMICLSIDARWESHSGFYFITPAPTGVQMDYPYSFQNRNQSSESCIIVDEYESYPIFMLLEELSLDTGIPIVFSSNLTGQVTSVLNHIPLEVALDIICICTGTQWKKGEGFYLIQPRQEEESYSLNYPVEKSMPDSNEPSPGDQCWYWEETRLDKAVSDLAFETEANLVLDAGLDPEQRITLTCEDCSLEGVLNKLCRTLGCTWKKTPYFYWILPSQCDVDQSIDDISKVEVVDDAGDTLDNQVIASESQESELQQRVVEDTETALFEQSLKTPRGLASSIFLFSLPPKRVRDYIFRDQLPELYRLLNDETFHRYAQGVCYIITAISTPEDVQSVEVLGEFIQSPIIETSDLDLQFIITAKMQVLKWMGLIGSEQVRTIQKNILTTEEGFKFYTESWLELVPITIEKKSYDRRVIAAEFRGLAAQGLAMSSVPEDYQLISSLHEIEYERCIKDGRQFDSNITFLSSARAVSEYIADHGRQSYLDIFRTPEYIPKLRPYIHKYTISPFGDRAGK